MKSPLRMTLWLIVCSLSLAILLAAGSTTPPRGEGPYRIQTDRTGHIAVLDARSGAKLRELKMEPAVVRRTFSLAGGRILCASQLHQAAFWNLESGEKVSQAEHEVYAFSPDEKSYLGVSYQPGKAALALYRYPTSAKNWELPGYLDYAPAGAVFSPDSRYLVVQFNNNYPISDEVFPGKPPFFKSVYAIRLYDVLNRLQIKEFSEGPSDVLGHFTRDSSYYAVEEGLPERLRFKLASLTWEKF